MDCSSPTVDVRDMVCAQALALVAKAVANIPSGHTLELLLNTDDVQRDVLAWSQHQHLSVHLQRAGNETRVTLVKP